MTKKETRAEVRSRLAGVDPAMRAARSAVACQRLCALPEYRRSAVVMIYLAMPGEIDTMHVTLDAWASHKRIAAPRVVWDESQMTPVEISSLASLGEDLDGAVAQPPDGPPVPIEEIDLVIVPGLAFDEFGNRLGRGRGFYDRFLARPGFRAFLCGLAFEEQVFARIPVEAHDVPIHALVTDASVRRFPPPA